MYFRVLYFLSSKEGRGGSEGRGDWERERAETETEGVTEGEGDFSSAGGGIEKENSGSSDILLLIAGGCGACKEGNTGCLRVDYLKQDLNFPSQQCSIKLIIKSLYKRHYS